MGVHQPRYSFDRSLSGEGAPLRLLVAEDHEVGLELICLMAERLGAEVDGVADGLQAIHQIEQARREGRPYALVLMDFMMPVVDGIEATRRLRRAGHSPEKLPVVALTAVVEQREVARFIDAGGQAYVAKPLNLEKLGAVLEAWLPNQPSVVSQSQHSAESDLASRYVERKQATLRRIDSVIADGTPDPATIGEVRDLLHKLAGTAGLFGDEALSVAAARCESAVMAAAQADVVTVLSRHRVRLGAAA